MAQLTIQFVRNTLADGFYLRVDVLSSIDIDPKCVVARIGREGSPESISRIGTLTDLAGLNAAPVGGYTHFQGAGLAATPPVAGDFIQLNSIPSLWTYLGYSPGTYHEVQSWDPGYNVVEVVPVDVFPAFGGQLSYTLYDSSYVAKGTFVSSGFACLNVFNSSWDSEIYYRLRTIDSAIPELYNAINKFVALQTEAQSLVDSTGLYLDEYGGSSTEVYT